MRDLCNTTGNMCVTKAPWQCSKQTVPSHVNGAQVTCGSVIKLQHANTGVHLHSHEISYGSGSGQQSVTGYTGGDDANDYWAVRGVEVSEHV